MKTRTAAIVALLTTALTSGPAGPALADRNDRDDGDGRGWCETERHRGNGRRGWHEDRKGWIRCDEDGRRPPPWVSARSRGYEPRGHPAPQVVHYRGTRGGPDRELWGAVIGGAAGGLLGSGIGRGSGRTVAIIGGTVLGALVGGDVGRTMDAVDRLRVVRTLEVAPTRQVVAWKNPDTDAHYEVTPTATYQRSDGRYCREYQTRALIGGEWQQLYGTACRQPDGSWEVVR